MSLSIKIQVPQIFRSEHPLATSHSKTQNWLKLVAGITFAWCIAFYAGAEGIQADVNDLVALQRATASAGAKTESEYAEVLKRYDVIVHAHRATSPSDAADVLAGKAYFYRTVLKDHGKASLIYKQVIVEFPGTEAAKEATQTLGSLQTELLVAKVKNTLSPGDPIPEFDAGELIGTAPSLSAYHGKPFLLVFWSMASESSGTHLAGITRMHEKYAGRGLDVLGVNLDRDQSQVTAFMRLWNVSGSSYSVNSTRLVELVRKYGITGFPTTYLIDAKGTVVAVNMAREALERELEARLPHVKSNPAGETLVKLPLSVNAAPLTAEVRLGNTAIRMLVDTGAEISVLDKGLRSLTTSLIGDRSVTAANGVKAPANVYATLPMQVQSLASEAPSVLLFDMPRLTSVLGRNFDGILGMRELGRGKVLFDYGEATFTMHTGDWFLTSNKSVSANLEEDQQVPVLEERIGDHPIKFTIDTGSTDAITLASEDFTLLLSLGYIEPRSETGTLVTAGGMTSMRQGYFIKGSLMGRALRGTQVSDGAPRGKGIMGLQWLSRFNWEVDFPARKLRYFSLPEPPPLVSIEQATGAVCLFTEMGLHVVAVRSKESAARAGLRPHDVIVGFGSLEDEELEVEALAKVIRSHIGSTVTVSYRRGLDGAIRKTKVQIPPRASP